MSFLDSLNNIIIEFSIIMAIIATILGGLAYYFIKVKKVATEHVEDIDYTYFARKDTLEYVKFEDIATDPYGNGMLVMNNGTRFIGIINTGGFDFFNASGSEQLSVMSGMVSFLNLIDKPVTFRQSTKGVDLRDNIKKYKEQLNVVEMDMLTLNDKYESVLSAANKAGDDEYSVYYEQLVVLQKAIKAMEFTRVNLTEEIRYMESIQCDPEFEQCWIYDWIYNENEYQHKLSKEEIYKKAMQQLNNKGNSMISALSRCNVPAERMTGEEIIELIRRQNNPISAERMRMREVLGTAYEEIAIVSDSADEFAEEAAIESGIRPEEIMTVLKMTSSITNSVYGKEKM